MALKIAFLLIINNDQEGVLVMPKKRIIPPPIPMQNINTIKNSLSKDSILRALYHNFGVVPDHRNSGARIPLPDVLMSAFAVFDLKDPSLLAFDTRRCKDADNLKQIYGINQVACDTQMRTILDQVNPELLRPNFKAIFSQLQRANALKPFTFYQGCYLLTLDGTGSYSSKNIGCETTQTKKHKNGSTSYYQQTLGAAIVHPDQAVVIPLAPEMIIPQDGKKKNDCERNAAKRFLPKFREDYPFLPVIVIEDGLSSNAPHIADLQKHNMHFILGAKPGDHPLIFHNFLESVNNGTATVFSTVDPKKPEITHTFKFINETPLNQSNVNLKVNFLYYEEHNKKTGKTQIFSWVTDFNITCENAYTFMRGGRCRWKIENETFNTLKNQGYHLEHNFGLGKKHLSEVFITLTMLAFLIDQVQQLRSQMFNAALQKVGSKRELWEQQRNLFHCYKLDSMEMLYTAIINGFRHAKLDIVYDE